MQWSLRLALCGLLALGCQNQPLDVAQVELERMQGKWFEIATLPRPSQAGCTGTTADNKQVKVLGSGEQEAKRNYFTILVDGRPVVENAQCLGASCHKKSG